MSVKQAPEELLKKYTEMGFKKMWINKEFQRFCSTFEGRITDGSVPIGLFLEKSGTDEIESKIFSFLFDADGDGKISFEEVLQSTGFMETDGKIFNQLKSDFISETIVLKVSIYHLYWYISNIQIWMFRPNCSSNWLTKMVMVLFQRLK